jgi:hypothetical protein
MNLTNSMGLNPAWEDASRSATQEYPILRKPKVSLRCSQLSSIGTYPKPDYSIPYHPILLLLRYILILFSHLYLGLPRGFFPYGFPIKILYAFLFSSADQRFKICCLRNKHQGK